MGNKSILMSIKPKWVAKILNGEKTIEVRKKFPKDYVGWVYIYCTKNGQPLMRCSNGKWFVKDKNYDYDVSFCYYAGYNGRVVARFWCDKVDIYYIQFPAYDQHSIYKNGDYNGELETSHNDIVDLGKIDPEELEDYINIDSGIYLYGIPISKLEIFDAPRLLTMFRKPEFNKNIYDNNGNRLSLFERLRKYSINKAPQNWCYIEE